jgi:3-methylcrotonyl-CoA carboxylase beta subunit
MCGRGYLPRFLFTWPNARISVMGAEQAAQVMITIKREQLEREGKALGDREAAAIGDPIRAKYETEGHPLYATARLWDDGIILPTETRATIGLCLAAASAVEAEALRAPVFRM